MKIFFGRARPKYGGEFTFFSLDSHFNSFPSGHSADAFVSGVFLYYLLKYSKYSKYRFLPLAYALLIAFSRVVVSAHYLSDAVAGMAIGILGAYFFLSRQHKQPGWRAIPVSKRGDVSFPLKFRITKNLRNPTIPQSLNLQFRFTRVKIWKV